MVPVEDLLGMPYQLGARLPGPSTDCFGLVVECCRRMGRPIPDPFISSPQPLDTKAWVLERLSGWVQTGTPVPGGLVELRGLQHPAHVGFLISAREFVHTMTKTGVVISRVDRAPWRDRIVGFYVYQGE